MTNKHTASPDSSDNQLGGRGPGVGPDQGPGPHSPGGRPAHGRGGPPPFSSKPGPLAEFVRFATPDKMMLHALLWAPKQTKSAAIYIPGFGGSFASPNDMNSIARILMDRNYALFAMNVRTVAPPGIMYARFEDCVADIEGSVQFLKSRGYEQLVLIGDSLGAPRALEYLKEKNEPTVKGLIVLGGIPSPYLEAQQRWEEKDRNRFDGFLAEVRDRVAKGGARELVTFENWFVGTSLTLSAETFLNMFGAPQDCSINAIQAAGEVAIPTLVLHGSGDTTSVPANGEAIYEALRKAPERALVFVDGDHFFFAEPQARAYGSAMADWLSRVLPTV